MKKEVANLARKTNLRKASPYFDVDGCLTAANSHALTPKQTEIFNRLLSLTGGAVTLFTDNDMRLIQPHMPHMPIISEGGSVTLLDGSGDLANAKIVANIPDNAIAIINKAAEAFLKAKHPTLPIYSEHNNQTKSDPNRIVVEAKQTRAGLNWGGESEAAKQAAIEAAEHGLKENGLSEIFAIQAKSFDCVEITRRGYTKPETIKDHAQDDRFDGCDVIMFGDSPIDSEAGAQVGAMIAIGDRIDDADHILTRLENPDELWQFLDALCDYYEENPHIHAKRTAHTPRPVMA